MSFGQCTPRHRHLVSRCYTIAPLCQVDIWSDVPQQWGFRSGWHFCQIFRSGWPLVRCTTPQWVSGQVDIFVRSSGQAALWSHLVARCYTNAPLCQVDLWSDVSPTWAETSCGQVWYYFRSGWPVYSKASLVPAAVVIQLHRQILKSCR